MNKQLEAISEKLDKILEFLDIKEHRLTTENSHYEKDTLQKLIADTTHATLRDALINRASFDSSSDYILQIIAPNGAKMFRSNYIPRKYGFMDYDSRYDLFRFSLESITNNNGIALEFGVYKGGSIEFMARYISMPIFGFDSFEGLPDSWFTGSQEGRFNLEGNIPNIENENISFIKGWYSDTVKPFLETNNEKTISFIHFDCDLYSSHKDIFDALSDCNINLQGTICLFDEYINYPGWENDAHKALSEFVSQTQWKYRYIGYTPRYTAVAIEFYQ